MRLFNLQIDDLLYEQLMAAAKAGDAAAPNMSKFVRDAIKEKIDRDVYGVEHVPTLRSIRQGMVAPLAAVPSSGNGVPSGSSDERAEAAKAKYAELKAIHDAKRGRVA